MQKSKRKQEITIIILVIFILGLGLLFFIDFHNTKESVTSAESDNTSSTKNNLDGALSRSSNLGINNLSENKTKLLHNKNAKLLENHYIGAYIGVSNNQIKFSGQIGYSNVASKNRFALDSSFLVGDNYQMFVNNAILLKLASNKKIRLNESLESYLGTEHSMLGKTTIKDLMLNEDHFVVRKSELNKLTISVNDLKRLRRSSETTSNEISANEILECILISHVEKTTYNKAIENLVVAPLGLANTNVVVNRIMNLNDVRSYKYVLSDGIPVQSKELNIKNLYKQKHLLRMSISDIALFTNNTFSGKYFSKKYLNLFKKTVTDIDVSGGTDNEYVIQSKGNGQYLTIDTNRNGTKFFIVLTNFKNKKLSDRKVATDFYPLLS
ncbi:hypothetical protein [Lactiplantibacillus plantarum]|uniref:hypothetical protein n=1 Tax=Lactiplantibacillus plantarum TaxID=1590 RepID=UPI003C181F7B